MVVNRKKAVEERKKRERRKRDLTVTEGGRGDGAAETMDRRIEYPKHLVRDATSKAVTGEPVRYNLGTPERGAGIAKRGTRKTRIT